MVKQETTATETVTSLMQDQELLEAIAYLDSLRNDASLTNALTRIGTNQDPSKHTRIPKIHLLSKEEVQNLHACHDIPAKVVEFYPNEMAREGIELNFGEEDAGQNTDTIKAWVIKRIRELHLFPKLVDAQIQANTFGGAVILLRIDDGRPHNLPVDPDNIRGIRGLIVKNKHQVSPVYIGSSVRNPEYYEFNFDANDNFDDPNVPITEVEKARREIINRIANTSLNRVHASRVIRFDGVNVSEEMMERNGGWGISVLDRFWEPYKRYDQALAAADIILHKLEVPIFKIHGLVAKQASNDQKVVSHLKARLELVKQSLVLLGAAVIDKDLEDIDYITRSLDGIDEVLEQFVRRVVSAADIPESFLFGMTTGGRGLSDNGMWERAFVAQRTAHKQNMKWLGPINCFLSYLMMSQESPTQGALPSSWSFEFRDTLQLTPKEAAELRETQSKVDEKEIMLGIVTPTEIRNSRHSNPRWSYITQLDDSAEPTPQPTRSESNPPTEEGSEVRTDDSLIELMADITDTSNEEYAQGFVRSPDPEEGLVNTMRTLFSPEWTTNFAEDNGLMMSNAMFVIHRIEDMETGLTEPILFVGFHNSTEAQNIFKIAVDEESMGWHCEVTEQQVLRMLKMPELNI